MRRALAVTRDKTASAKTRVEYVTRTIETIRETTDPETSRKLGEVQGELFKVTAELREAQDARAVAETQTEIVVKNREDILGWGVAQQTVADANADGWRNEEAAHQRARADRDKAIATANRRGNTLGALAGGAMALLGLTSWGIKLAFAFPPWSLSLFAVLPALGYFGARLFL